MAEPAPLALEDRDDVYAWSFARRTRSGVLRARSLDEIKRFIEHARGLRLSVCVRGAGNSFGDQILNDGQLILDVTALDRILSFDAATGRLRCQAGATMEKILALVLPENWTLDACVGTAEVTVGGAVANDVHGKGSWKTGNFAAQVRELTLMTASGEISTVSPAATPELFRAVVGGMGLLGVVLEVELQCRRIPGPFVEVTTTPTGSMRELLQAIEAGRQGSDFLVGWVDAFATGAALGRGFALAGKWVEGPRGDHAERLRRELAPASRVFGVVPAAPAWALLRPFYGPAFVRAANAVRYRLYRRGGVKRSVLSFPAFNFMHNRIPGLNTVFRPHGFLEFQPLVPREGGLETLEEILRLCQRRGTQSLLCGVKPHAADDCLLGYALDGYSIGVDVHLRGRTAAEIEGFSRELFTLTAERGGRAYACKDQALPRDLFERMYPRLGEFKALKRKLDPEGIFASDLYRRLIA